MFRQLLVSCCVVLPNPSRILGLRDVSVVEVIWPLRCAVRHQVGGVVVQTKEVGSVWKKQHHHMINKITKHLFFFLRKKKEGCCFSKDVDESTITNK